MALTGAVLTAASTREIVSRVAWQCGVVTRVAELCEVGVWKGAVLWCSVVFFDVLCCAVVCCVVWLCIVR